MDRLNESYFFKRAFGQGISDSYTSIRSKKSISLWKPRYLKMVHRLLQIVAFIRKARIQIGYLEGYCYHQDEVRNDPDLYGWVMRETYLA
jgi:hypothetical protein